VESIKEIFRFGKGPSSSHTMGPRKAAEIFKKRNPDASGYEVSLLGSLAATGKGHLTDIAIEEVLGKEKTTIVWKPGELHERHPNALTFKAFDSEKQLLKEQTVFSVGGGKIEFEGEEPEVKQDVYPLNTFAEIVKWCQQNGRRIWEFATECEGNEIMSYLKFVWEKMHASIANGLESEGALPGPLKMGRKASLYYARSKNSVDWERRITRIFAYALAVSEENAGGGEIVTAPTCGSAGVLPATMLNVKAINELTDVRILRALATAGILGNIVKTNASISGAEAGCQAEIGTACAMAAGAAVQLFGGSNNQIGFAAEMGMEHNLGVTCDPVLGLVQIPCIERNAMAAMRAISCAYYAVNSDGENKITFDQVTQTMMETGKDMHSHYRETSTGGLARHFLINNQIPQS
jgi:L-serine dehydratase